MKMSETQAAILRQAAEHEYGLAPLPKISAAARNAVFRSMLASGLLAEFPAPQEYAGHGWRQDEAGGWIALRTTDIGLAAIGLDPAQKGQEGAPAAAMLGSLSVHLDAPNAADGPSLSLKEPSTAKDVGIGRASLRAAATAVIAAWEAVQPLDAPLTVLRAILVGRPAHKARSADAPRQRSEGTKQAAVLALLRRPEGTTVAQVMEATGWQQHTARGFFAGLKARHGIEVQVLERVRQVGPNKTGAKGSYSVYQIAVVVA